MEIKEILEQDTPEGKIILQEKCRYCGADIQAHIQFEYSCGRARCKRCKRVGRIERE